MKNYFKNFEYWINGYFGFKKRADYKYKMLRDQYSEREKEILALRAQMRNQINSNFEMLQECKNATIMIDRATVEIRNLRACKDDYEQIIKDWGRSSTDDHIMRTKHRALRFIDLHNVLTRKPT